MKQTILSDKMRWDGSLEVYEEKYVKQFIKTLKYELLTKGHRLTRKRIKTTINRLAGSRLVEQKSIKENE